MAGAVSPLPAFPDHPALEAMGKRLVFVAKVLGPNREHTVINGTGIWAGATVEQILALQNDLPKWHGVGLYHFQITDSTGGSPRPVEWSTRLGAGPDSQDGGIPIMGEVQQGQQQIHQLGGGLSYNESLGILTARDGRVFQWRVGEPLPAELTMPRGATPVATEMPVSFGRGAYDPRIEELLRSQKEDKIERGLSDVAKMIADSNAQTLRMIEKLAEGHRGPDPQVEMLRRELEENKRQAAEDRRIAEARVEADRREAAHRAEMQALKDSMKELAGNRQDPTMALLGNIITTMQTTANSSSQNIREITALITEKMGGSQLTPERLLEVLRIAKDRGPENEIMKSGLEMYRNLFSMTQDVLRQQQEIAASNQPPWYMEALDKVANVGQAVLEQRERTAAEERARREQAERVRMARAQQQRQRQQPQPPQSGTVQTPPATPQPGRVVGQGPPAVAPVRPDAVIPAAPSTNGHKKRKQKSLTVRELGNVSAEELRAVMDPLPDDVFFGPFYPHLVERLRKPLAASTLSFFDAAQLLLRSRAFFPQAVGAGQLPPAAELLLAGQLEILVDRALPDAVPAYRTQVVESLRAQLQAAGAPPVEEAEGDEVEDAGDGAEAA